MIYFLSGFPLTIPSIFYYQDDKHYELSLLVCVGIFLGIHVMLAVIAVLDSGCGKNSSSVSDQKKVQNERCLESFILIPDVGVQKPGCCEKIVR